MERQSRRVSSSQWEILIEFLEKNPSLARDYNNSAWEREQSHRLWCQLTDMLNDEGSGAYKTSKGWATYFNNFKSKLKKLVADRSTEATATGGGPALADSLSELELRVLAIMGPGFGLGIPNDPIRELSTGSQTANKEVPELGNQEVITLDVQAELTRPSTPGNVEPIVAAQEQPLSPSLRVSPSRTVFSPSHARVPSLPRQIRRTRYRTRPMAPIDEAQRILSQIERQRATSDAASARALDHIGTSLARIAAAFETYVSARNAETTHGDVQDGV